MYYIFTGLIQQRILQMIRVKKKYFINFFVLGWISCFSHTLRTSEFEDFYPNGTTSDGRPILESLLKSGTQFSIYRNYMKEDLVLKIIKQKPDLSWRTQEDDLTPAMLAAKCGFWKVLDEMSKQNVSFAGTSKITGESVFSNIMLWRKDSRGILITDVDLNPIIQKALDSLDDINQKVLFPKRIIVGGLNGLFYPEGSKISLIGLAISAQDEYFVEKILADPRFDKKVTSESAIFDKQYSLNALQQAVHFKKWELMPILLKYFDTTDDQTSALIWQQAFSSNELNKKEVETSCTKVSMDNQPRKFQCAKNNRTYCSKKGFQILLDLYFAGQQEHDHFLKKLEMGQVKWKNTNCHVVLKKSQILNKRMFRELPMELEMELHHLLPILERKSIDMEELKLTLNKLFKKDWISQMPGFLFFKEELEKNNFNKLPLKAREILIKIWNSYFLTSLFKDRTMARVFALLPKYDEDAKFRNTLVLPNWPYLQAFNLSTIFQGGGPILGKFIQTYAPTFKNKALREVLLRFLNKVPPMNREKAQLVLENARIGSYGAQLNSHIFKNDDSHQQYLLASGTIAQVYYHMALKDFNAIKIRRINVDNLLETEKNVIQDLNLSKGAFGLIDRFRFTIEKESDFIREAQGIKLAKKIYTKRGKISVVGLSKGIPVKKEVMAMNYISGMDLCDLMVNEFKSDNNLTQDQIDAWKYRYELLMTLYLKTMRSFLFGSGFFHADLHAGNIKFQQVKNHMEKLFVMDLGSHIQEVPRNLKKEILGIILDIHQEDLNHLKFRIKRLLKDNSTQIDLVVDKLWKSKGELNHGFMGELMTSLVDADYVLPVEWVLFYRTKFLQEQNLLQIRKTLEKYEVNLKDPHHELRILIKKNKLAFVSTWL